MNNFGVLALYKKSAMEGNADIEKMYQVVCVFWSAVKSVFPEAWGIRSQDSRLMHSTGIQAMGILMDRIMLRMHQAKNVSQEVEAALHNIAPYCAWSSGVWSELGLAWNEIENTPRHIRILADFLVQHDFAEFQKQASE